MCVQITRQTSDILRMAAHVGEKRVGHDDDDKEKIDELIIMREACSKSLVLVFHLLRSMTNSALHI